MVVAVDRIANRLSDPAVRAPEALDAPATEALCACVLARGDGDEDTPTDLLWTRELLALVDARVVSLATSSVPAATGTGRS